MKVAVNAEPMIDRRPTLNPGGLWKVDCRGASDAQLEAFVKIIGSLDLTWNSGKEATIHTLSDRMLVIKRVENRGLRYLSTSSSIDNEIDANPEAAYTIAEITGVL